ncbi:MAG: polyhydroxyalkanoate synthesis repressor PhaR [Gammaproteobacteria bacterium]|nr:MAG: polyhydroxyalkanoate synthesis repressor PhaR [Gammaproteobacteria bacterium]
MVGKKAKTLKVEPRIIKKYPNRRLYDTKYSHYITLHDVHDLVRNDVSFHVIDVKTGADLTRSTLLHIIYDQEEHNLPLITSELLKSIIGFYDDPMHSLFSRYLEHSITVFKEHLVDLKSPVNSLLKSEAQVNQLHDLAEDSLESWKVNNKDD